MVGPVGGVAGQFRGGVLGGGVEVDGGRGQGAPAVVLEALVAQRLQPVQLGGVGRDSPQQLHDERTPVADRVDHAFQAHDRRVPVRVLGLAQRLEHVLPGPAGDAVLLEDALDHGVRGLRQPYLQLRHRLRRHRSRHDQRRGCARGARGGGGERVAKHLFGVAELDGHLHVVGGRACAHGYARGRQVDRVLPGQQLPSHLRRGSPRRVA